MSDSALRLIDADGVVVAENSHTLQELQDLNQRQAAELNGYRLRLANLQREIRDLQGVEPEAEEVRMVLGYWAKRVVEEGWYTRRPTFKPGDERWSAVRGRLKSDWTAEQLFEVVEGALAQPRQKMKRAWLDATSIFRNERNASQHYEFAQDPRMERVKAARELPEEFQAGIDNGELKGLLERCDCGHLRMAHCYPLKPEWTIPEMVGWQPCLSGGCDCMDFDDIQTRMAEWRAKQA